MVANVVVRARIDENVKSEATVVLAEMGLTVSDAFRLMMIKIVREKTLPFDIAQPPSQLGKKLSKIKKKSDI